MNKIAYLTKKVKNTIQNSGFLLINKPSGPTSHDVIDQLRRITGIKQIGHAGTLDPFASGLLLIGIGEATKLLRHYVGLDKKYEAVLRLGATSDTFDRTGVLTKNPNSKIQIPNKFKISKSKIQTVLKSFVGKQKQLPPMFSAKKVGGKKLYELARQGQEVKRSPINIEVYDIQLTSCNLKLITCNFHVSSGAYIRALAHDIGQKLGCGAYLEELKRTEIGEFKLKDAIVIPAKAGIQFATEKTLDSRFRGNDILDSINWQNYLIPIKTVLVSGTFDGVHEGHKNYFQQARQLGQRLICIVARDQIAEQIKGRRPRHSEKERLKFVKECPEIDRVYLGIAGSQSQIYDFTASLKPDVIALGYDQTAYTENLEGEMQKRGLAVKIVRLKPHHPQKYHSSVINGPQLTGKQKTANL